MNTLLLISDLLAISNELTCLEIVCASSIASSTSLSRLEVALRWANFNEMIQVRIKSKSWTNGEKFGFDSNGAAQQDYNCNLKHNEGHFFLYVQLST